MSETLSQTIANTLRESIQLGTYAQGDRLVELTLSRDLEVSQNTIRDSLHILEREGWVMKIPRRGVYIPIFDLAEAEEIFALWQAVEALALKWMLKNISDIERRRLRQTVIEAEQYMMNHEANRANRALRQVHTAIALHANAPRTQRILLRLHNQSHLLEIHRLQQMPLTDEEWEKRLETYFDLIYAIVEEDERHAQRYLKQLLQNESDLVLPFIR